MSTPEHKHRKATPPPMVPAELSPAELDYWLAKRQALILEIRAIERNFLPHIKSPVGALIDAEQDRQRPRR